MPKNQQGHQGHEQERKREILRKEKKNPHNITQSMQWVVFPKRRDLASEHK